MIIRKQLVDRPIFIIGSGRTGTTLIYRVMGGHPDLAWFSNFSARFPHFPPIAFLGRLYRMRQRYAWPRLMARLMPVPSEAYEVFDVCRPVVDSPYDPPLTKHDVNEEDHVRLRSVISGHVVWQGAKRFVNKNTRNTRRIEYLNAMFPDAFFIHIIRDPRAAAASLLKVDWWPNLKVWCQGNVTPGDWAAQGKDPAILAAILWREENRYVLDRQSIFGNRYLRIYYEHLVGDPWGVMEKILVHCGLEADEGFEYFVHRYAIKDMNYKFRGQLSVDEQIGIMREAKPILSRLEQNYS
jgi:hypothetical protein